MPKSSRGLPGRRPYRINEPHVCIKNNKKDRRREDEKAGKIYGRDKIKRRGYGRNPLSPPNPSCYLSSSACEAVLQAVLYSYHHRDTSPSSLLVSESEKNS